MSEEKIRRPIQVAGVPAACDTRNHTHQNPVLLFQNCNPHTHSALPANFHLSSSWSVPTWAISSDRRHCVIPNYGFALVSFYSLATSSLHNLPKDQSPRTNTLSYPAKGNERKGSGRKPEWQTQRKAAHNQIQQDPSRWSEEEEEEEERVFRPVLINRVVRKEGIRRWEQQFGFRQPKRPYGVQVGSARQRTLVNRSELSRSVPCRGHRRVRTGL
jgi:hypothetical protein